MEIPRAVCTRKPQACRDQIAIRPATITRPFAESMAIAINVDAFAPTLKVTDHQLAINVRGPSRSFRFALAGARNCVLL